MARLMVLASFDQKIGNVTYDFSEECDLMLEPADVTLGFRQVFRKCFSAIHHDKLEPVRLNWLKQEFTLFDIYFFESIGTSLAETEGDIFILGFVLETELTEQITFNRIRVLSGVDEQGAIYSLIEALPAAMRTKLTNKIHHSMDLPGLTTFALTEEHRAVDASAPLLFGFFYLAKLLLWRIRRDQAEIDISLLQRNFRRAIFLTAIQRSRIINIKRYQLTSNISNSPDIRTLADQLKKYLNLEPEYRNDEELNTLIEEYLASLEKLFSEESRRRIERGVTVFSFVAVPFTVLAAFIGMATLSDQSDIFWSSFRQSTRYGFWLLLIISTAIPTLIYLAISLNDKEEKVGARLEAFRERSHPSKRTRKKPQTLKTLFGILFR